MHSAQACLATKAQSTHDPPGVACLGGLPTSLDASSRGLTGTLPADAALWRALASLGLFSVAGNSLTVRSSLQGHELLRNFQLNSETFRSGVMLLRSA